MQDDAHRTAYFTVDDPECGTSRFTLSKKHRTAFFALPVSHQAWIRKSIEAIGQNGTLTIREIVRQLEMAERYFEQGLPLPELETV